MRVECTAPLGAVEAMSKRSPTQQPEEDVHQQTKRCIDSEGDQKSPSVSRHAEMSSFCLPLTMYLRIDVQSRNRRQERLPTYSSPM
jgi:hypothetical protein